MRISGRRARDFVPRMWQWYIVTAILVAVIGALQPQQLPVVAYKVMMMTLACAMAHTIDRTLFSRESDEAAGHTRDGFAAARIIARALVYLGSVLGVTLGI